MVETIVAQNDRRSLLIRRRAVLTAMPEFKRKTLAAVSSPQVQAYGRARRQFHSTLPQVAAAATYAVAAMGGALMHTVQVRNLDAESEREERREREAQKAGKPYVPLRQPIYKDEEQPFGTLKAGDFFMSSDAPERQLAHIVGRLEEIHQQLPALSTKNEMVAAFRGVRDCLQALKSVLDQVDRLPSALSQDNLELMAAWASARKLPGRYATKPGAVEHVNTEGALLIFTAPPMLGATDRQFVQDFENALIATQ
ncbi:hypothetical protein C4375_03615 [Devosia sp. I507]|nr:hypothetical protein C4375_03615 [Devosia sp. I507]